MEKKFERFPVYKKALILIRKINCLCLNAKQSQFNFLKDQIRRASASIVLNIAEGSGKWTKKDKMNFYRIAQASGCECIAALDLFWAHQLADERLIFDLKNELRNIVGDLQALIFDINKRRK